MLLYRLCTCFFALAIVCDDYFVVSLEKICEKLSLTEDVAGATFMATGSSAPELFASIIGVFITHGDVGVGTIVGSAVFNILCIVGVCSLFAGQVVHLTKYAVFRDSFCYTLSVLALMAVSIISYPKARSPLEIFKWLVSWPILFLLSLTLPDVNQPRWEKYYLVSFFGSTVWIAVFSYVMVWMVTVVGFTLGIPDVIMGITFLAAGTSVPDCMASLLVARQGQGDMAVSNSLGSNVFDILIGLGVPWSIQTLAVLINSRGLFYSVVLLLGSVTLAVLGIHVNGWRLDTRLGVYVLLLYVIFLTISILIEYNVFTFINLPMCLEG
uniref:Sodium/calcium exchanger membrane region domain-containing protein n=1 Tax=Gadus morhua TaxID=8049 RepID=A0A8C5F4T0_GADMO